MALSATFDADFSAFVNESNKAAAALTSIQTEAVATADSVTDMASRTTVSASQAATALNSMGTGTTGRMTQLTTGLRSVDASLNAMGVSISKPIAALEELTAASGKSISSLGAMGTAAAVLGTAMAAWEFGKWAAEWSGMNTAIQSVIYSLDLTGEKSQVAALNAEILAKASKSEGRAITDLAEAREINYRAMKKHTAEVDTAIHRQALWEKEIRNHRDVLPAITAALENHTGTVAQLAKQYGMTAEALDYYVAKNKAQTAAQDEATRKAQAAADAQKKLQAEMFGTDSITKANEYQAALGGVQNLTKMTAEEQAKLNKVVGDAIEAYKRMGKEAPASLNALYNATVSIGTVTTGLGSEWANVGTKVDTSVGHIVGKMQELRNSAAEYEAETQRMADEFSATQAKNYKKPLEDTAKATDNVTKSTQQLSVALRDMQGAAKLSTYELLQASLAVDDAYRKAGIFVADVGGAAATSRFLAAKAAGVQMPTSGGDFTAAVQNTPGRGIAWGTGQGATSTVTTLNVNVNSTDAQNVADKLVAEMRRNGVRL